MHRSSQTALQVLLALLLVVYSAATFAQPVVRLIGGDAGSASRTITSASNPLPVSGTISSGTITTITNPVGVKGVDGSGIATEANPVPVITASVAQASITNTTASVANSSTTITLAAASRHIIVKTDPAAAIVYVDLANGTATSADFRIEPGGALAVDLSTGITAFKYIGASATGTISVCAY